MCTRPSFESNPQSSPESSYKFIKKLTCMTVSSIFYNRPFSTACSFSNLTLHGFNFPLLEPNTYTEALSNSFSCIKKRKTDRILIVIKNNVTQEVVEVYTIKIIYKNVEDENTEKSDFNKTLEVKDMGNSYFNYINLEVEETDNFSLIEFNETDNSDLRIEKREVKETEKSHLSKLFKRWHTPGVPEHIIIEMKCLVTYIREVAAQLPVPSAQYIDINLVILDTDMEAPNFNFSRNPSTMTLGSVQSLYHHFSLSLSYLDDSKFKVFGKGPCVPTSNNMNNDQYSSLGFIDTPPCSSKLQYFSNMIHPYDGEKEVAISNEELCELPMKDMDNEQYDTSLGAIPTPPCSQMSLDSEVHRINSEDEQEITLENKKFQLRCSFEDCTYKDKDHWKIKRHIMRHHTKERPYKCTLGCSFSSCDKWHLKRHMMRMHYK